MAKTQKLKAVGLSLLIILALAVSFLEIPAVMADETEELILSYGTENQSSYNSIFSVHPSADADDSAQAQTVQIPADSRYVITEISWYLQKVSSNPGNLICRIYRITGTFGSGSKPTGLSIASSDLVAGSTISTGSYALYNFSFTGENRVLFEASAYYAIDVECYDGTWDGTHRIIVGSNVSSPSAPGDGSFYDVAGWQTASSEEFIHYVYGFQEPDLEPDLVDSFEVDNYHWGYFLRENHPSDTSAYSSSFGQSFDVAVNCDLQKASFEIYESSGAPSAVLYALLYAVDENHYATGEPLAQSFGITPDPITGDLTWVNFTFPEPFYELEAEVEYSIQCQTSSWGLIDNTNRFGTAMDLNGNGDDGFQSYFANGAWTSFGADDDFDFRVYAYVEKEPPTYTELAFNSTMLGTSALFSALWDDNVGLDEFVFGWNFTGSWSNETAEAFSETPGWSNITKDLGSDVSMKGYVIQWQIWAWDLVGNTNNTGLQSFTLTAKTITFYHESNGSLVVDDDAILNGTSLDFAYGHEVNCTGLPEQDFILLNFTWNTGSTNQNPLFYVVNDTDSDAIWAYFIYNPYPVYSQLSISTQHYGEDAIFTSFWDDAVEFDGGFFGCNATGSWVNQTWAESTGWINHTITLTSKFDVIQYEFYGNNTAGNWNYTGVLQMIVHGYNITFTVGSDGQLEINGTMYDEDQSWLDQDLNTYFEFQAFPNGGIFFTGYSINGEGIVANPTDLSLDNDYSVVCGWQIGGASRGEFLAAAIIISLIFVPLLLLIIIGVRRKR